MIKFSWRIAAKQNFITKQADTFPHHSNAKVLIKDMASWLPNCLPTGIGSVPHTEPRTACEIVLKYFATIPYWPQLPNRSYLENMYVQVAHDLPGAVIDEKNMKFHVSTSAATQELDEFIANLNAGDREKFAYSSRYCSGYNEFLRICIVPEVQAVKGQLCGPISLGLAVTDEKKQPLIYHDIYRELIIKSIALKARIQDEQLGELHIRRIVFLDEPYLSYLGSAFVNISTSDALLWLSEILNELKGLRGIHCCSNTDWSLLLCKLPISILSFDAYAFGSTLVSYHQDIKSFLANGGIIAWGIVPTTADAFWSETESSLLYRLETIWRMLAEKGLKLHDIASSALITPSCGTGSLSIEIAERVLELTAKLSRELRKKYELK